MVIDFLDYDLADWFIYSFKQIRKYCIIIYKSILSLSLCLSFKFYLGVCVCHSPFSSAVGEAMGFPRP